MQVKKERVLTNVQIAKRMEKIAYIHFQKACISFVKDRVKTEPQTMLYIMTNFDTIKKQMEGNHG
jgi:hypothetical protein